MQLSPFRMFLMLIVALAFGISAFAAVKTYQFTGTVKTVDAGTFTVEKSATETWSFVTDSSTKGTPKVGDRVTVQYKMVATTIDANPAAAKPSATKPAAAKPAVKK